MCCFKMVFITIRGVPYDLTDHYDVKCPFQPKDEIKCPAHRAAASISQRLKIIGWVSVW